MAPKVRAHVHHPERRMHQPRRPNDADESGVAVFTDRGLRSGKYDQFVLTPDEAVELATELLDGARIARKVNAERRNDPR